MTIKKKIITEIWFNWIDDGMGNFCKYVVGEKGVISIIEHQSMGEGDKWSYSVDFDNNNMERIFNPNRVIWNEVEVEVEQNRSVLSSLAGYDDGEIPF